jgi:hypothetical protein
MVIGKVPILFRSRYEITIFFLIISLRLLMPVMIPMLRLLLNDGVEAVTK